MKIIIIILIVFVSSVSYADDSLLTDSFEFLSGIVTAYGAHELGHAGAAWTTNTELIWESGTYNQPLGFEDHASSSRDGMIVYASGLLTQIAISEIVLQSDTDKNAPFVRGMMFFNIVNPIIYALDYWFIRNTNFESENYYQGDLEGLEHYSNERTANIFAIGMLAISTNQGYRYMQTQNWCPKWMQNDSDFHLNLLPVKSNGIGLFLSIAF